MADEKKPRKKAGPRPFYLIIQVLDEQSKALEVSKDQIRIVKATRNPDDVLSAMDSNEFPNATYKRVTIDT